MTQNPAHSKEEQLNKPEHGLLFTGHLNSLTSDQEKSLSAFKESLATAGLYKPALPDAEASHTDPTLL